MGRMFGSTRFMASEEFELGALIDEQTNVFVMGRRLWSSCPTAHSTPARSAERTTF